MRYFEWKCHSNVSDTSYDILRRHLALSDVHIKSLGVTRRYLQSVLGIRIRNYDRCINNCMVFVGDNLHRRRCQYCRTSRFHGDNDPAIQDNEFFANLAAYSKLQPRALYSYIPLTPRLKLLYANPISAAKMLYRTRLEEESWDEGIRDVWEGARMTKLKAEGSLSPV